MTPDDLVGQVVGAIDAALPEGLFGAGQGGAPDGLVSVLWCAALADVERLHPSLPQALDEVNGPGGCVDLMVELDAAGRLVRADLESLSIAQTFAALGDDDLGRRAAALHGAEASTALPELAALVRLLLDRTRVA